MLEIGDRDVGLGGTNFRTDRFDGLKQEVIPLAALVGDKTKSAVEEQ